MAKTSPGGNKINLSLTQLPDALQAIPYLEGLPLVVTIAAAPDVIRSLVAYLPSPPPLPLEVTVDGGREADVLPRARQATPHGKGKRASSPSLIEDSQPEDLWDEVGWDIFSSIHILL